MTIDELLKEAENCFQTVRERNLAKALRLAILELESSHGFLVNHGAAGHGEAFAKIKETLGVDE